MKKNFIAVLLIGAIASTFTACSGKISPTAAPAGSSSVPASLVSSDSAAQDSAAQPDSSEPVYYANVASSIISAASSDTSTAAASGASAIKTGVVKSGLTVTAPAKQHTTTAAKAPSKATVSPAKPSTATKTPVKTSTGTSSKPATKPASKPSTTTPSKPASNPYAGYTAWKDTHNQDILTSMARNSPYGVDTYANDIHETVTNSSTAPWDVRWEYDTPAGDYGNGYISLDQLNAKFNKTYQVAFSSKHRYVVTAIYTDSAQYSRANPKDVPNQIKATGILNKKYSGLYYDFCYGYYTASNIKVGKAVRVTFILKQIA